MPNNGDSVCIPKDELARLREQVAKLNWYIAQDLARAFDGLAATLDTHQAMLDAAITLIAEADPCPMPGGHACCTDVSFCEECVRNHLDGLVKEAKKHG